MKKIVSIAIALSACGSMLPSAFAAETIAPANQPNNGFYEGPDPEWATLHSTDARGTTEHRQYHRDAVKAHLTWHEEHKIEQGADAYTRMHRLFHQQRNMLHRLFHSMPLAS